MHLSARATIASVIVLLSLAGCGDSDQQQQGAGGAGGSAGAGGEGLVELPDAGLPAWPCPPGERLLDDDSCQPAGIPPEACGPWFEPVDGGCRAIMPATPCPSGWMAVPGETECREPAPCGTGTWGDIPVDGTTQYVDGAYTGGGSDGSVSQPWTSVQQGVDAAAAGAVVAIAEGTYDETLLVNGKAVRLWGVCPAKTALVATGGNVAVIRLDGAHGTEIHNLAVSGPQVGIQQRRTTDVVIEGVWIHDLGHLGLDVERAGGDVSITVRDTLVERSAHHAVFFYGAEAILERFEVRETQHNSEGHYGRAIVAVMDPGPALPTDLTLRRVVARDNYWAGIDVLGSKVTVEDSLVLDMDNEPAEGDGGYAMWVQEFPDTDHRSEVLLQRVELGRSTDCGLGLRASTVEAEALTVHDIEPAPAFNDSGIGVCAFGRPVAPTTLTLRDALVDGAVTGGVLTTDSDATLDGVLVRNVELSADPLFGRGIAIQSSTKSPRAGTATIRGARIETAPEFALLVLGADAVIDGVHVLGDPTPNDVHYRGGIGVQMELISQTPAAAEITRSLVENATMLGVGVVGADATIEGTHVRATRGTALSVMPGAGMLVQPLIQLTTPAQATIDRCLVEDSAAIGIAVVGAEATIRHTVVEDTPGVDDVWGDGIVVSAAMVFNRSTISTQFYPAAATVSSSLIADSARAGIFVAGAEIDLADTMVRCATIDLNGEPLYDTTFAFLDDGGNLCGCDGLFPPCKVLSEGLQAPEPVTDL